MTDPLILAFDTSDAHCAVAVLCGTGVLAQAREDMAKGQSERLMGLIEQTLADADTTLEALDAIAVGVGPGNFTGIRIGISAARGLALGLGVPALGVTRFDALQYGSDTACIACIDARREMVFAQGYGTEAFADPALVALTGVLETGLKIIGAHGTAPAHAVAVATGQIAIERLAAGTTGPAPRPLYLRPADAAPARDAPPVIVP